MPGNEFAMPPEKRIRSRDAGQLLEHLPPEDFAFDSQPLALVVAELDSFLSELLSEDSILCQEILDGVLLTIFTSRDIMPSAAPGYGASAAPSA